MKLASFPNTDGLAKENTGKHTYKVRIVEEGLICCNNSNIYIKSKLSLSLTSAQAKGRREMHSTVHSFLHLEINCLFREALGLALS